MAHQERHGQLGDNKKMQGATLAAANKVFFQLTVKDAEELALEFAKAPPVEIRLEEPYAISQNPVSDLLRQGRHTDPDIRQFVDDQLRPLQYRIEAIRDEMEGERLIRADFLDQAALERIDERISWVEARGRTTENLLGRAAAAREGRTVQVDTKIMIAFEVWEESFEGERFLFPQEIRLSANYFESLQAHAVPLDERAVAALAHSAMGLDVYAWLAQRLHRVDPQRGQFIPWTALHAQFGQGYDRIRKFREVFFGVLKAVTTQYPAARVKTDKGGMLIGHSPPPAPQRHIILLPTPTLPKA